MSASRMAFLRSALAPGAAMAAAALLWGASPLAYGTLGATWAQPQMPYVVNSANLDLPGISVEGAVRAGGDAWQQQSAAFRFVYSGPSAQTTSTNDSINLVLFRNSSSGQAIATTYSWSTGSRIVDADVVFWDAAFQFFAGTSGCSAGFFIEDIAAHEFGHALGLGHSTSASATMYPSVSTCSTALRTLDADDIAGARALYPLALPRPPTGLRFVK
jgi:Matrixin